MTIGEIIKLKDIRLYRKLLKLCRYKEPKPIPLGDNIENLMKHDSHKRINRRMRQLH